jgi:hypothetical protein
MRVDIPFAISPEAEQHLRDRLANDTAEGMEPSLTRAYRLEVRDKSGQLVERCEHEHFCLGYSPPAKHVGFSYLEVAGFRLAIHPQTLDKLRGRVLSVQQLARLDKPSVTRDILVAIPIDENTPKV